MLKVTQSELDVLKLLASGIKIDKAAKQLGIKKEAAWSRVKQAYQRNGIQASHSVVVLLAQFVQDGEHAELI